MSSVKLLHGSSNPAYTGEGSRTGLAHHICTSQRSQKAEALQKR